MTHLKIYRSEAIRISDYSNHFIGKGRKPFQIRLLTELKKQKYAESRENFLTASMKRLADDKLNEECGVVA